MLPRRGDRADAVCGIHLRKCNCRRLAPIAAPPNRLQMLSGHAALSTTQRYIEADIEAQRKGCGPGLAPDCLAAAHDGFLAHCSDPRAALRSQIQLFQSRPPSLFPAHHHL